MRLWHKELIPVLPKKQLLEQWRKCCLIIKNIKEKGIPNHVLVNKIMDYPLDHFYTYCHMIEEEMRKRGYTPSLESQKKIFNELWSYIEYDEIFKSWHTEQYLYECLYNLEEKASCKAIPKKEWDIIYRKYNNQLKRNRQIVLCEKCIHGTQINEICFSCERDKRIHYRDWFCADGEKRYE